MLRFFFVSDVHGSERCFRKFVNAAKFYSVNVIILGGDLTGKAIVPILRASDGTFTYEYMGEKTTLKNEEGLKSTCAVLSDKGYYPYVTDNEEIVELQADKAKLRDLFLNLMKERLRSWVRFAEERLKGSNVQCFMSPGNDDPLEIDEALSESETVTNPENKVVTLGGRYEMITLGYTNPTPWNSPREVSEDELAKIVSRLTDSVRNIEHCIFNFHCPPYNTKLDEAPMLTKDLKPVFSGGDLKLQHVGSAAIRKAIEYYQPLLGLHGHIHESRAMEKIGRTVCLNPGSQYQSGILNGAIVQIDNGRIKNYMFTSG
jgi:hypothetical protein